MITLHKFRRWALALPLAALLAIGLALPQPAHADEDEAPPTKEELLATGLISQEEFAAFEADEMSLEDIAEQVGYREEYREMVAEHGFHAEAFDFFVTSMLWTCIAAALVFIMHLGFASLEAGLTRSKNTVNILFKNVFIISVGIVTYALIGFNTHYPGDWMIEGWLGIGGPIGDLNEDFTLGYGGVGLAMTGYGDFIFQAMFAATAATIVSGSVAERIKLPAFMIFATLLVAIAYPIAGSWHWGEGWLSELEVPFYDFAGSTVVHAFGGFAALACVMILGPRRGKYTSSGIKPIFGHSMPLAAIGVFLLFFGWFGFNGGSVLSAEPKDLGLVFTTTALAAASGALVSMAASAIFVRKPDLSMALNGVLAGLVSITAGADVVGPWSAVVMGAVGGVIVVASILFLDRVRIDDPVGAISVHGIVGVWGTLAVAIFGVETEDTTFSFFSQLAGVVVVCGFAFIFSYVVFSIIKLVMGVRVSEEIEEKGLDVEEHGAPAYHFGADASEIA